MYNLSRQDELDVQQMDDQVYGDEAESCFENEEENNDEDATYDEDEQALERDAEDEQIRN